MSLPNEIVILGSTYKVVAEPLEGDDCGITEVHKRLIRIDSETPYEVQVETLMHELVHAMLGHMGIDYLLDPKTEEAVAQGLGMCLTYVLAANPYFRSLKGEDNE